MSQTLGRLSSDLWGYFLTFVPFTFHFLRVGALSSRDMHTVIWKNYAKHHKSFALLKTISQSQFETFCKRSCALGVNVTSLDLSFSWDLNDLTPLQHLPQLKKIDITCTVPYAEASLIYLPSDLSELTHKGAELASLHLYRFTKLIKLNLCNCTIDSQTDVISTLTTLQELDLWGAKGFDTVDFILPLTSLKKLTLSNVHISDWECKKLTKLNKLTELDILFTKRRITDETILSLTTLPFLEIFHH